jgi:hypothetical protein
MSVGYYGGMFYGGGYWGNGFYGGAWNGGRYYNNVNVNNINTTNIHNVYNGARGPNDLAHNGNMARNGASNGRFGNSTRSTLQGATRGVASTHSMAQGLNNRPGMGAGQYNSFRSGMGNYSRPLITANHAATGFQGSRSGTQSTVASYRALGNFNSNNPRPPTANQGHANNVARGYNGNSYHPSNSYSGYDNNQMHSYNQSSSYTSANNGGYDGQRGLGGSADQRSYGYNSGRTSSGFAGTGGGGFHGFSGGRR